MANPRELELRTSDVMEAPLHLLIHVCGFLASKTTRAVRGEERITLLIIPF
jgi:hypothetical protein